MTFVQGDITEPKTISHTVADHGVTHIVHLAALQVPFCKADPVLGAQVNVTGTVNVFEAAKQHGLGRADRLRELRSRIRPARRGRPAHPLRRLQARERGHRPDLLAGRRRRQHRAAAVLRLRPRPRPGHHRRPDARDRRGRPRSSRTASPSAAGRSSTTRRTSPAPSCRRRARRRTARTRSASAARRPRSPTSSPRSRRRFPAAEITFDEAPLPFPDELPAAVVRRPAHPARAGHPRDRRGLARRHIVAVQQPKKG